MTKQSGVALRLARMLGEVAGKLDRGEQVDPQTAYRGVVTCYQAGTATRAAIGPEV